MVVQNQWDLMIELVGPPERGYGQLSDEELYGIYVEHKGDSHRMFVGGWSYTCEKCI